MVRDRGCVMSDMTCVVRDMVRDKGCVVRDMFNVVIRQWPCRDTTMAMLWVTWSVTCCDTTHVTNDSVERIHLIVCCATVTVTAPHVAAFLLSLPLLPLPSVITLIVSKVLKKREGGRLYIVILCLCSIRVLALDRVSPSKMALDRVSASKTSWR